MIRQEETDQKYIEYLHSESWKMKARARLEIDNYTCQGCGSKGSSLNPLQVHHMTYHNIYNENEFTDLVVCCRSCHALLHNVLNRVTSPDGKKGFKENPSTPNVNTFVLSGADLQTRKGNLNHDKGISTQTT